ncbi:hypothetical protein KC316_g3305 [Hortaea werneckii]|nr:hypothetical protein KC324_g3291 [Hortaea werneckii]KAI7590607.1 hypothetical protein KC316_g3305 [Hortaea werneckii]
MKSRGSNGNPKRLKSAWLTLPGYWTDWQTVKRKQPELSASMPTLVRAVQEMYIDKLVPRERGEFARVLMIHGLFHRSWAVETYFSDPLSQWEPVASRQDSGQILTARTWLPANPIFARWQNSACDVMDILHWQAQATMAQANGHEHPTVQYLHTARIVLLAPYREVICLARFLGPQPEEGMRTKTGGLLDIIRNWAIGQQYKARLSVVHAGATFWYARRYSVDSFCEAPSIALAALTLWAFGVFAKRETSRSSYRAQQADPTEPDDSCRVILLDRPTDDELVQRFIRYGGSMEAHLGGVGDLYDAQSPELVLQQGCKLLRQAEKTWGVAKGWRSILEKISTHWKRN